MKTNPRPDFMETAREWLVRAQGHARVEHERSLADEFAKLWELGIANAIEAVHAANTDDPDAIEAAMRALTDKPADPRGN